VLCIWRLAEGHSSAGNISVDLIVEKVEQILSDSHDVVVAVLLDVGVGQLVAQLLECVLEIVHGRLLAEVLETLNEILADGTEHSVEHIVLARLHERVVVRLHVPA
ncbi:hypothetical protein PMAYCL1PPCAC_00423, partial [Pristionchus mayeri]